MASAFLRQTELGLISPMWMWSSAKFIPRCRWTKNADPRQQFDLTGRPLRVTKLEDFGATKCLMCLRGPRRSNKAPRFVWQSFENTNISLNQLKGQYITRSRADTIHSPMYALCHRSKRQEDSPQCVCVSVCLCAQNIRSNNNENIDYHQPPKENHVCLFF